jgi:hypothetical protein
VAKFEGNSETPRELESFEAFCDKPVKTDGMAKHPPSSHCFSTEFFRNREWAGYDFMERSGFDRSKFAGQSWMKAKA